jgi:hypothetical protein
MIKYGGTELSEQQATVANLTCFCCSPVMSESGKENFSQEITCLSQYQLGNSSRCLV